MRKERIEDKEHQSAFKDEPTQESNVRKSEIKDTREEMEMKDHLLRVKQGTKMA